MKINYRDKFLGMMVGGAIGDALGFPVESWTPDRIRSLYPDGVQYYVEPIGHKWFDPAIMTPGCTTDDTQLTIATAHGLLEAHPKVVETGNFDHYFDAVAAHHVKAAAKTTMGWGNTTREAVRRLANGVSWRESGKTSEPNRGHGNGVPMKLSPFLAVFNSNIVPDHTDLKINQKMVDLSAMTHWTKVSAYASVMHELALHLCFHCNPTNGRMENDFGNYISDIVWDWEHEGVNVGYDVSPYDDGPSLKDRMIQLARLHESGGLQKLSLNDIRGLFGNGSCSVYDSLPFSYAWFLRNPYSMDTILEVVNAGGDTDTNAKMVGEMIGALLGLSFFQKKENIWAINGLHCYEEMVEIGNNLYDTFQLGWMEKL